MMAPALNQNMRHIRYFVRQFILLLLLAAPSLPTDAQETTPPKAEISADGTGRIQGQLLSIDGEPSRTAAVFVFVCDAKTGWPLVAANKQPLEFRNNFAGMENWLHTATNIDGRFQLNDVPVGEYRLVAQSWPGQTKIPTQDDDDDDGPLMLHGSTNNIEVIAGQTVEARITALENCTLRIKNTPDEGNAYIFLGLNPTLCEPIPGPYFWGEKVVSSICGATHIKRGTQNVFGLPDNTDVHMMLLNYDNNAGVGSVTAKTGGATAFAKLPIYATWSNGNYQAPKRSEPLVDWLRTHKNELFDVLTAGKSQDFLTTPKRRNVAKLADYVKQTHHAQIQVDELGEFSVIDVLAGESYLRLLESHEARTKPKPVLVPASRLLVIGIDGCRPDALAAANTPNLDALIEDGAFTNKTKILGERYNGNDTVSGPGWSSFLTGVWADKHGVHNNKFEGKNYATYPHFFKRIKQQFPQARTGSFVDWAPIQEHIVESADIHVVYPAEGADEYAEKDILLARAAGNFLIHGEPHAAMVYFGAVDETGHKHGFHPSVPEYVYAIETVDEHIGTVIQAMKSRSDYATENWLVVVSTDHGGKDKGHSNGHEVPEILTTFLIVSGQASTTGEIEQPTYVVDVAVTGLAHLGVALRPDWKLDGKPVGLQQSAQD